MSFSDLLTSLDKAGEGGALVQPQGQEAATEEFLKIVVSFSVRAFTQNQLIKN